MRKATRFLLALAVALVLMLCFRALAFTICTVEGAGLEPLFHQGDRVLVNRWSYGLRVGGDDGLISYRRIGRSQMELGDLVAFENPQNTSQVLICRCKALPGDTIEVDGQTMVIPARKNCASTDHYWLEAIGPDNTTDSHTLGLIPEQYIIGRAVMVIYNHDTSQPIWRGWDSSRFFSSL